MLKIPVPSIAYSNQEITLAGIKYNFKYAFNGRDQRWRLSIYIGDTPLISGVKIMENERLLWRYRLPEFQHGDLYCLRVKEDGLPVGRNNFGVDLPYELIYLRTDEIAIITNDLATLYESLTL